MFLLGINISSMFLQWSFKCYKVKNRILKIVFGLFLNFTYGLFYYVVAVLVLKNYLQKKVKDLCLEPNKSTGQRGLDPGFLALEDSLCICFINNLLFFILFLVSCSTIVF